MAEINKDVSVTIKGKDETGKAFKSASNNALLFGKSVTGVESALAKLGASAVVFTALYQAQNQVSIGMKNFQEELDIMNLTKERLKSAGIALDEANPKIEDFIRNLEKMGMSGEQARNGVGILATKTKDLEQALKLTKMASDLSASGFGTIQDNVDRLSKVLTGNGSRALLEYGIKMEGTHSKVEQLDAIQSKITRTTEEFGDSTEGRLKSAENRWDNFRKGMGKIVVFIRNEAIIAFNDLGDSVNNSMPKSDGFGKTMAKWISDLRFGLTNLGDLIAERSDTIFGLGINDSDAFYKKLLEHEKQFEKDYSSLSGEIKNTNVDTGNTFGELTNDAEEMAKKIKDSFIEISKKLVSSFNEQTDAISNLRSELKDLETDTQSQLDNVDKKYQEDLKNRAKQSQDRIKQIDEEIKKTREARGQGWRTQIADLEAEKAKEQSILARVGGEVSNLNEELAKDDLTLLKEKMEAEKATIQEEANKTKAEKELEIGQRTGVQLRDVITSLSPNLLDTLTAENQSFLGQIGAGANQYIFNFNGNVNDADTFLKMITDALNRQATLRGVAGK